MKSTNDISNVMDRAIALAKETMCKDIGGPFGAAVIDADGKIIAVASNSVLSDHDPTAHAEMNAIRIAGQILGTHDLSGCTIVTTCYPCPMCLGAIIWANIKKVVYGCIPKDAEAIGFRDDFIYQFMKDENQNQEILTLDEAFREKCLELFKLYKENNRTIY